jgi:hypothetical protein
MITANQTLMLLSFLNALQLQYDGIFLISLKSELLALKNEEI